MNEETGAGRSNSEAEPQNRGIRRRQALAVLGAALAPGLARAQEAAPAPTPNQTAIPTPATNPFTALAPRPATIAPVATPLGPVDKTKAYVLFFQQTIDLQSVKVLRNDLAALAEGGAKEITLVISSGGGLVTPALQLYSLIRSLPVKIKTHAQAFVASAANLLYLAGEERTADANAKFVFHPSQSPMMGVFNSPQIDDQMRLMNDSNDMLDQIYRDRTKLPEADIKRFQHEMVIYSASEAVELGIVHRICDIGIPGEGKSKLVFLE